MEPLPRSWLIMVSLCTILHGHGILAKIMTRSWQDLGKASKELAMDLGKGIMASNTGLTPQHEFVSTLKAKITMILKIIF